MGFRNIFDRFPKGPVIREHELLALVAFPTGLNRDGVGGCARQPEARWNARLED
jgi:hypothetical protein